MFRDELLLIDGIGLVCLLSGRIGKSKPESAWWIAALLWSSLPALGMLILAPAHMGLSFTYFCLVVAASVVIFAGSLVLAQRRGILRPWAGSLFFYFTAFLLLCNTHHPIAPNFNHAIATGLEFPHYFLGELLLATVLLLSGAVLHKSFPKLGFYLFDVVSIILVALAIVDFRLSQILGVRLGWDVVALGGTPTMMWRMAAPYLPKVVVLLGLFTLIYSIIIHFLQRWLSSFTRESKSTNENSTGWGLTGGLPLARMW